MGEFCPESPFHCRDTSPISLYVFGWRRDIKYIFSWFVPILSRARRMDIYLCISFYLLYLCIFWAELLVLLFHIMSCFFKLQFRQGYEQAYTSYVYAFTIPTQYIWIHGSFFNESFSGEKTIGSQDLSFTLITMIHVFYPLFFSFLSHFLKGRRL